MSRAESERVNKGRRKRVREKKSRETKREICSERAVCGKEKELILRLSGEETLNQLFK
jgi:hypothetical protein